MTSPLTNAVLKSGLISEQQLAEFRRWKAPIDIPEKLPKMPSSIEEAAQAIEQALQSEGYIISRDTDLDILRNYLGTQRPGLLHVEIPTDDPTVEDRADIPIAYGMTPLGEVILPWTSESISNELTNGYTYFLLSPDDPTSQVFFDGVRDLFFGEQRAFMVCRPTQKIVKQEQAERAALPAGEDHGSGDPS